MLAGRWEPADLSRHRRKALKVVLHTPDLHQSVMSIWHPPLGVTMTRSAIVTIATAFANEFILYYINGTPLY